MRAVLNADYYLPRISIDSRRGTGKGFNRDLYWLDEILLKRGFSERIASNLSTSIVYYIAKQLKYIIRSEFPKGEYEFTFNDNLFHFSVIPRIDDHLEIILKLEPEVTVVIDDFENLEDEELIDSILGKLTKAGLALEKIGDFRNKLEGAIKYGLNSDSSIYLYKSFADLNDESGFGIEESFSAYLLKICESICERNPSSGNEIIREFLGPKYKNPVFKRLAIYLIGKFWSTYREVFWKLTTTDFRIRLFNEHSLNKEVYYLLRHNALHFTLNEKAQIKSILDEGPNGDKPSKDYWALSWLSALREVPEFVQP